MEEESSASNGLRGLEASERRCPCVLLLDTSASMQGAPIEALNSGLRTLRDRLLKEPSSARQVELAVITFDSSVEVVRDFVSAEGFDPPVLGAQGLTRMGAGILLALDRVQAWREQQLAKRLEFCRPWVFLLTDGEPQAELDTVVQRAVQRLRNEESRDRVSVFGVGYRAANLERLGELLMRKPLKLRDLDFQSLFGWIAANLTLRCQAGTEEPVLLPPGDWAMRE